jgi:histidinol-phosphate aminotransferase
LIAAKRTQSAARPAGFRVPLRLDLVTNPYAPSPLVATTMERWTAGDRIDLGDPASLRRRIGEWLGFPTARIVLTNGIEELGRALLSAESGPIVLFPPTAGEHYRLADERGADVVEAARDLDFAIDVAPDAALLPRGAIALAMSPNDPTGTLLTVPMAVRLARRCAMVVIDERYGAYTPRTLLPLAREFDNVVVLRTFEIWAGLDRWPLAFAVAPSRVVDRVERDLPLLSGGSVVAANAVLDDLLYLRATVEQVRAEKSRLLRTLRKLNMLRPHPSWANFVLATVERGSAAYFERELLRRGIVVHRPRDPLLADTLRISATTARATDALKRALIDAATTL